MVFLCDLACWRPPATHAGPLQRLPWGAEFDPGSSEEVLRKHPALGDPTCLAHLRAAHQASGSLSAFGFPGFTELGPLPWKAAPDDSYGACLQEVETSFVAALSLLFEQSALRPEDVDILVTNSSIFAPTPSLSSMLVNKFKLKPAVSTLSVAGMGCSFGVLGVGALRDLMRGHERARRGGGNVNAVFVTGECLTAGFYLGKDPMMLAATSLMRQGAAAVWLSTKSSFALGGGGGRGGGGGKGKKKVRAKYKLLHFVKTHHGADDVAYKSMGMRGEKQSRKEEGGGGGGGERDDDEDGDQERPERRAIYFSRDIPGVASKAIDAVLRQVAPKLLSPSQLVQALLRMRREKRQRREQQEDEERKKKGLPPAVRRRRRSRYRSSPAAGFSFASCCDHFALHPGVHSMLIAFMKGMRLPLAKAMPSFAALKDYGNLSSASTWYVLANLEAVGAGIRKGERVLQLGVGSGVKAGVCVWKALRDINGVDHAAWRHLKGVPVEERDLPLAVPDVLAAEAAKADAAANAGGESGHGENGNGNTETAKGDENAALAAATALVSQGEHLVSAADEEAGTQRARARKQALPEVRASAMEEAAALARELDAMFSRRKRRKEREVAGARGAEE